MKILRNRVGFDDVYCNGLEICKSQGDYDHAAVGCLGNLDRPAAPTVMMQPLAYSWPVIYIKDRNAFILSDGFLDSTCFYSHDSLMGCDQGCHGMSPIKIDVVMNCNLNLRRAAPYSTDSLSRTDSRISIARKFGISKSSS